MIEVDQFQATSTEPLPSDPPERGQAAYKEAETCIDV
jgi:hypothetical protein